MREKDYRELMAITAHFYRGGLPHLGKEPKGGYRWTVGQVMGPKGPKKWRENLGHDLLLAQYRAREMTDLWSVHVDDCRVYASKGGVLPPIDAVTIPPLDQKKAKAEAWAAADEALRQPSKLAAVGTEALQKEVGTEPALAPGFKLVAVPIDVPDALAKKVAEGRAQPAGILTLFGVADRWLANLWKRSERGDVGVEYFDRSDSAWKSIKRLVADVSLCDLGKPELDEIRMAVQADRNGKVLAVDSVRTELGVIKSALNWAEDNDLWPTAPRKWEKKLRAVFRRHDSDGDVEQEHDIYTIDELGKLYANAGYSMRLWILCALNFGWGQKEISTARKRHWKTAEPDQRRVARFRHKRLPGAKPVPGKWTAWPETWEAAVKRMSKTTDDETKNPKGYAFLTTQNQTLVRRQTAKKSGKGRRYDSIRSATDFL